MTRTNNTALLLSLFLIVECPFCNIPVVARRFDLRYFGGIFRIRSGVMGCVTWCRWVIDLRDRSSLVAWDNISESEYLEG